MSTSNEHSEHAVHIVPIPVYLGVFIALVIGTLVTWQVSLIDLGRLNAIVALTIAVCKATLVVLFFMHVKYSTKLTKLVVICGVFWLLILLTVTEADLLTRTWMGVPGR
jgi:cytochrome c oxidase subunit 4